MTRVVVLPSDETGCGLYRMKFPAGAVHSVRPDWTVEVYRPSDVLFGTGPDGRLWQVQGIRDPHSVDLLVMQRVSTRAQHEFVKWMRANGVAVVVDTDDALWAIDRDNVSWKHWNEGPSHWRFVGLAADEADLVTVTTSGLAQRYGKHGRVEVLGNCVPGDVGEMLRSVRDDLDQTPTVGWAGFTSTHPGDLEVCGDALARLKTDTGCIVRCVGDGPGAAAAWGVEVEHVQPAPIGLPYYTALTTLDIGLVPLADTTFNRSKSYLKALEYAACGVAVVASDTPANRALSKHVPIFLASSPQEWYDSIELLITEPNLRADRVALAREAVFTDYTYEANAERWAVAWERAMTRHAKMQG